ncbi:hypothetical protein [Amycolatopsis sp. WAC 04182]|uniref:hypothetical protein n=1 Tax=Amycolatopsis sp. WAC 04182 TaxID=2203198 RepID=UPI000F79987F|nr:hypothetical protein [Amycolatopsis sp. WAC 04182]
MRHLEIDQQWLRYFAPTNVDGIAEARATGRRAGRGLQLKTVTFQSKPEDRDDGSVAVIVAVNQEPPPEDKERMEERSLLLLDEAFKNFRTPWSAMRVWQSPRFNLQDGKANWSLYRRRTSGTRSDVGDHPSCTAMHDQAFLTRQLIIRTAPDLHKHRPRGTGGQGGAGSNPVSPTGRRSP